MSALRVALRISLLAFALGACSDLYVGRTGDVFEAHVTRVIGTSEQPTTAGPAQLTQLVEIELDGSLYRGDRVEVGWGGLHPINANGLLREGDRLLVSARRADDGSRIYTIEEVVRWPALAPFAVALAAALIVVARLKGLAALAGLAASVTVVLVAIVPAVARGEDPLAATLVGAVAVLVATVYLVHGLNRKSTAALLGTLGGVVAVAALGAAGLVLVRLTGLADEEAVFLAVGTGFRVDMPRLVLAGILVGSLGALVDMAVGQASTTFELASVDPTLRGRALYGSALNVGRDHIGSLVNTLALAYFGGALPLIVLLSLGQAPLAVALNGESIVTSVLTVLVASIGLVLCVPLATAIAVMLVRR